MKTWIKTMLMVAPVVLAMGCEPWFAKNDKPEYSFINKSRYRVRVIPQSAGWSGFSIAPGERHKVYDNIDVFFSYEPEDKVLVGVNEGDRIVFVNYLPSNIVVQAATQ